MTEKRGKMIVHKCDVCKEEITDKDKLLLRTIGLINSSYLAWDIHLACLCKITDLLGGGRKIEISRRP